MHLEKLKNIIKENEISYCVVANLNTNLIDKIGDVSELDYKDLVEQLFGNIQQIKTLNDSLEGQLLPRSWKQGNIRCLVCKPKDSIIIGLFYNESRSFMESIHFGDNVTKIIENLWK